MIKVLMINQMKHSLPKENFKNKYYVLIVIFLFIYFIPIIGNCKNLRQKKNDLLNKEVLTEPLIYFSTFNSPDDDIELKKKIDIHTNSTVHLNFGANFINNKKILIIKNNKINANSFASIEQLFIFIVKNSKHGKGKWEPLEKNIFILFYTNEPLILSCGKICRFFKDLIIKYMNFSPKNIKWITMFSNESLKETSVQKGYLSGGHVALELFFPEMKKWIVFDLDKGVIPTYESIPLSMIEICRLNTAEINFDPVGLDKYGKGNKNKQSINSYYKEAKDCFGFGYRGKYHFLFLKEKEFIKKFKQNFELSNNKEAIIYTDPFLYFLKFY